MNRFKISTIIGCICLLATIIIFALAHPVILPSTIVAFLFILYAEVVFLLWFKSQGLFLDRNKALME